MRKFAAEYGFLTLAQNNKTTDYLHMALLQARSIKSTQKNNCYAVIVDQATAALINSEHKEVFDHVIVLPNDRASTEEWKQANETQVFSLTPFRETIKLEADLLMTRSIDHWQHSLRLKDLCFSYHCQDYQGNIITRSPYRKIFDQNQLPDIYTGMYYFRYSQTSALFFKTAQKVYDNWHIVSKQFLGCDDQPSTDLVYSVTAKMLNEEQFYIPTMDFFNFVHMKSKIQGWNNTWQSWTDWVNIEHDNAMIRINNCNQYAPVHYYEENFIA